MTHSPLSVHWRFAAGQAFAGLRDLVCTFNFLHLAGGHAYVGVEPDHLIEVIDGFLGEPAGVVFGGDRAELRRLRQILVEQVLPTYQQGLAAGRLRWHEGDRAYGGLPTEELHHLALQSFQGDLTLQGWFAEGFCFAHSREEMESVRGEAGV